MVVMALDHTRDFFHRDALVFDPTNLERTHALLFLTRWVTHYCMPGFVLLAGLSIALALQRKCKKELGWYLLSRGLWFILLDVTVMRFAYLFNFYYDVTFLSVLWLFGICMVLMSGLIYLPRTFLLVAGLITVLLHNLSALVSTAAGIPLAAWWTILFGTGFLKLSPEVSLVVTYPVIPWLGVMLLGFSLGNWFSPTVSLAKRTRYLVTAGLAAVVLFVAWRVVNQWGDPAAWAPQSNVTFTLLSFLNTSKYPPSPLFLLMTLGPLLLLLAWLEQRPAPGQRVLTYFGRVPLFYFIVHFYLIHALALISYLINSGLAWHALDFHFAKSLGGITPEGGIGLAGVYVWWALIVVAMYFLCRWYANIKRQGASSWWRFL